MSGTHENEALNATKQCTKCGQTRPLHEFYVCRTSPDGRGYQCAECLRAAQRERNQRKRHSSVELRIRQFTEEEKNNARFKTRYELDRDFECAVIGCHRAANLHHLNYADYHAVVPLCKHHHAYLTGAWILLIRVAKELGIDADAILEQAFLKGFNPDAFDDPDAVAECEQLRAASRRSKPQPPPTPPAAPAPTPSPAPSPAPPRHYRYPAERDNPIPRGREDGDCGLSAITG